MKILTPQGHHDAPLLLLLLLLLHSMQLAQSPGYYSNSGYRPPAVNHHIINTHTHTHACKSLMHICLFTVSSMSSFSECSDLSPGGSVVVRCKLVNPEVESVLRDWLILYPPVKWHVFYPCCFTHSEKQMFCAADAGGAMICLIFRGVTTIDSDLIMVRGDSTANMDFAGILSMFVSCFFWTLFMIQVCSAWECLKS